MKVYLFFRRKKDVFSVGQQGVTIRAEIFSGLIKNALNNGTPESMTQYLKDYYDAHESEIDRITIGPPISEDKFKKLFKKNK